MAKNLEQVFIVHNIRVKDVKVTSYLRIMTTMQSYGVVEKIQQTFFALVLNGELLSGLGLG